MNKNEKFVITINRELGSGGRTVGRKLAEKLGVEFYDKAVIVGLQEKYHLTVEEIEKLKGSKQGWWADFKRQMFTPPSMSANYYIPSNGNEPQMLTTEEMFRTEQEILKGIVEHESCVIAGRSGFFAFRNFPNRLSILIQASLEHRIQRVMRKQGLAREEVEKIIQHVDKMRENYVNKFTNTSRYDTRNYDLVISMDGLTEDDAVAMIMEFVNRQK
jgi:cytidylate kinase